MHRTALSYYSLLGHAIRFVGLWSQMPNLLRMFCPSVVVFWQCTNDKALNFELSIRNKASNALGEKGCGELHVEICLKDLKDDYAQCDFITSDPVCIPVDCGCKRSKTISFLKQIWIEKLVKKTWKFEHGMILIIWLWIRTNWLLFKHMFSSSSH